MDNRPLQISAEIASIFVVPTAIILNPACRTDGVATRYEIYGGHAC